MAPEYCCIAALRGLELKNNNPAMWNRLQLLMDHGDENKKSEMEYYEMFKVFVVISLFINCVLRKQKSIFAFTKIVSEWRYLEINAPLICNWFKVTLKI